MKMKAGIFDIGNVLCTFEIENLNKKEEKIFYLSEDEISLEYKELRNKVVTGEINEDDFWKIYLNLDSKNHLPPKEFLYNSFKKNFIPLPTLKIIDKLSEKGMLLGSLSNTIPSHVKVIRESKILEKFSEQMFSCEGGIRKPNPEIYKLMLKKLNTKPTQTFFVDDLKENVDAAEKLGIKSILFQNTDQLKKDLQKIGLVV